MTIIIIYPLKIKPSLIEDKNIPGKTRTCDNEIRNFGFFHLNYGDIFRLHEDLNLEISWSVAKYPIQLDDGDMINKMKSLP